MTLCGNGGQPQKPLVVVGSINADIVLQVERMPQSGETISAESLSTFPGGKGANQAAAAARLGHPTVFLGQVGQDANAAMLREALQQSEVDTQHMRTVDGPSGTAMIMVDSAGENTIVIVGGANTADWAFTSDTKEVLRGAGALLLQREVPEHVNIQAAQLAREAQADVVLDCGGAEGDIAADLLRLVTILSPNETELSRLTGLPTSTDEEVTAAADDLIRRGVQQVLVKLGAKGSVLVREEGVVRQPIVSAGQPVRDTTGAGDCFTAAFAVAILQRQDAASALKFAATAAGICVTREGAMPSLPWKHEV